MPDLAAELKSGDHRRSLIAMRDVLADHLLIAEPSVSAQIAARLQAVLTELAATPSAAQRSTSDQLREQREKRRKSA